MEMYDFLFRISIMGVINQIFIYMWTVLFIPPGLNIHVRAFSLCPPQKLSIIEGTTTVCFFFFKLSYPSFISLIYHGITHCILCSLYHNMIHMHLHSHIFKRGSRSKADHSSFIERSLHDPHHLVLLVFHFVATFRGDRPLCPACYATSLPILYS